jgi:prophage regulatory protein
MKKVPIKILSFGELNATHGIRYSRQHLSRLENARKFPRRVPVGEHHIGWVETEIDAYLEKRLTMRPD